jgi:hypothetical protein
MHSHHDKLRRVTADLPERLLNEACRSAGKGVTETLVQGLEMVRWAGTVAKARRLKGKLKLNLNLDESRER